MPIAQYRHNYLQDYSGLCKWKPSEKNSHDVDFAEVRETRNQRERFSAWRMKKKWSSKIQVLRGRSSHSLDLLGIPVILPNLNSTQDWKSIAHSLLNRGIIIWHAKVLVEKKEHSHWCILKKMFLFITHSPHGNQDILGFWIPRRGCRIAGTGFQSLSVELGFWIPIVSGIPWAVIWIPKPRIPDSTSKHVPDLEYGFPYILPWSWGAFWARDYKGDREGIPHIHPSP